MSVKAQLAQSTKLYIEGSSGSAETISGITLGYPTFLTYDNDNLGIKDGDIVTLANFAGTDAAILNGKTFVVTHTVVTIGTPGSTTFAIEINTTGLTITDNTNTATATPSQWTQIKEIKGLKPSGASASSIDVSDLDSVAKEFRTGLIDNGTFSADLYRTTDDGQDAVYNSFVNSTVKGYKITSPGLKNDESTSTTHTRTFSASCTKFPTIPDAVVDGVQTGTIEWKISGAVTLTIPA